MKPPQDDTSTNIMTTKPKILYLSTSLNIGGTEKFLLTLVEKLSGRYEFHIGYLKDKGEIGALLEKKGLPVRRFSFPGLVPYLKRNDIRLLHTFLYRGNVLGRLAGRLAHTPAVISTQQSVDAWKGPFFRALDRLSAKWCDLIVANSLAAKDDLVRRVGISAEKIEVIYNGLDLSHFAVAESKEDIRKELKISSAAKIVLSVARLHREKGVDYLPRIAAQTPNAFFVLVGDGPEKDNLRRSVTAAGLDSRFLLLGWRSDIPRMLAAADVFILPSREESFPQAVLEAMALRLPVVAADVGGVKELVEDGKTGFLLPPGDITGFAKALTALLSDTAALRQMGQKGFEKAGALTEEKMVDAIDAVYRKLLQKESN